MNEKKEVKTMVIEETGTEQSIEREREEEEEEVEANRRVY